MSRARYSDRAKLDLAEIARFIAYDKPIAARKWAQKLRDACKLLASRPGMGEHRTDLAPFDCRSFSVGPYVIFFKEIAAGIEVVRVLHGSQDVHHLS